MQHEPSPGPDGDPRPGLVTDQPLTFGIERRDLELSIIAGEIESLLFRALQAHALGAIDTWTIERVPTAQRERLREHAEAVVRRVLGRTLYHERALRQTVIHARRWMEAHAIGLPEVAEEFAGRVAEEAVRKALARYIDDLTTSIGPNLITEIMTCYEHELTQPLTCSARGQVVKTAFNAMGGDR